MRTRRFGGTISVGQRVKVKALRLANGQLVAVRIELLDSWRRAETQRQ